MTQKEGLKSKCEQEVNMLFPAGSQEIWLKIGSKSSFYYRNWFESEVFL